MADYRSIEEYNSFENELREAFRVARDQLNQEEVRIINFYRNLPRRAYHRTSRKEAIIEQLTEIYNDIDYKLVSPQLDSIKCEAMRFFDDVIKKTQNEPDVSLTEADVSSIVNRQLEEFEMELKRSRETLDNIMYGSFLSDQSNSILQRMHGLKSKLADSVKGPLPGVIPPLLLVPDGSHSYGSDVNPCITEPKRSRTDSSYHGVRQVCTKQTEGMQFRPEPSPLIPELAPYPTPDKHESLPPIEAPLPKPQPELELEPITAKTKPPDYTSKGRPLKSAGTVGLAKGLFKLPKGIAYDSLDEKIFITESGNIGACVQIYSIAENTFTVMAQTFLTKPYGVAVSDEYLFVTDLDRHAVVQFNMDTYEYVRHAGELGNANGQLNTPYGLCVDRNLDVYVADNKNNRVSVFKKQLIFKENIGVGKLTEPKDVKLTKETVAVLDAGESCCLHFFSRKTGQMIRSCITIGKGKDIYRPMFLFLDTHLNILISDNFGHAVGIFDQLGERVHTIGGGQGHGEGQLFNPTGLFVSKGGEVVVVSSNKNHILQFF